MLGYAKMSGNKRHEKKLSVCIGAQNYTRLDFPTTYFWKIQRQGLTFLKGLSELIQLSIHMLKVICV